MLWILACKMESYCLIFAACTVASVAYCLAAYAAATLSL